MTDYERFVMICRALWPMLDIIGSDTSVLVYSRETREAHEQRLEVHCRRNRTIAWAWNCADHFASGSSTS